MNKQNELLEVLEKKVSLKSAADFKPKDYYQHRTGLYVFSSFIERIVSKAKPIKTAKAFSVSSFKLTKRANDAEIEDALGKAHIFKETEVCAVIASLIEKQLKGEDGVLLNDGWWNLFYTPAFVVSVGWGGDEWCVDTWKRDGRAWDGGRRVFSPVN